DLGARRKGEERLALVREREQARTDQTPRLQPPLAEPPVRGRVPVRTDETAARERRDEEREHEEERVRRAGQSRAAPRRRGAPGHTRGSRCRGRARTRRGPLLLQRPVAQVESSLPGPAPCGTNRGCPGGVVDSGGAPGRRYAR